MKWNDIRKVKPQENQRVIYFFDVTGVGIGNYHRVKGGALGEDYTIDVFQGSTGFLGDDVTHWMPIPEVPQLEGTCCLPSCDDIIGALSNKVERLENLLVWRR